MKMLLLTASFLTICLTLSSAQSPSVTPGSCGNFTGCCDPASYPSCLGTPPNCYCDQICYEFNDCCSDIGSAGNCLAASNEPTADTGSCVNLGYDGCCNPNLHVTCTGDDNICYCDQVCFQYGDCCSDINQIGCFINANSPSATSIQGSCSAAGYESCCNPSDSANCYGNPPTCYCDQACFQFNDCCPDIGQICTSESPTNSQGTCAGLGFNTGCCEPGPGQNCHGSDGNCYCDLQCYDFGDCCTDIEEINCLNVQPSGDEGSCVQKNFEGCCDPNQSDNCYGSAGTSCYCDELCYQYGDCCFDISQIGCLEPSTPPVQNNGSCLLSGFTSCCEISPFEQCVGSDGSCRCDANCYNYGDCCKDIAFLQCTKPTNTNKGTCQAAGYKQCCHPYTDNVDNCYGEPQTCYCDAVCYSFGDCCDDIASIGCVAPSGTVTPNAGLCSAKNYTSCCVPSDTQSCLGYPETCHCDAVCHDYGDCCSDVIDIGCFGQTGSCAAAGRTSCCLSDDPDCTGKPANCFCDQGCFDRNDCCNDIGNLANCKVEEDKKAGGVLNLKAIPLSDTSINVTWNPPTDTNGANTYLCRLRNYTKTPYDKQVTSSLSIYQTSHVFKDLIPYHPYNVTVVTINQFGFGKWRGIVAFSKQGTPLVAPKNVKVTRTDTTTITVSWSAMNHTEGRGIVTGYQLTYSTLSRRRRSNDQVTVKVNGRLVTTYTVINLDPNKKYGFTVAGMTKAGIGIASAMSVEAPASNGSTRNGTNYGMILGIVFGAFGLVLATLAIVFIIVLVYMKGKPKGSSGGGSGVTGSNYTRLLVNNDDDDDDELID